MNVLPTARRSHAGFLFSLLAAATLFGAGCSFDTGITGLECSDEGASRPGEVCRDGYWRVDADAGLDGSGHSDVPGPHDGGSDTPGGPDGCTPRGDEEICLGSATCSDALGVTDRCTGTERTIDCTRFFDFDTDPLHCGGCDIECPATGPNSSAACAAGACSMQCEPGWVDANDDPADGCESECTPSNGGNEICDGLDNDCDGEIDGADAADAQTYFRDVDGDGYGDPADTLRACSMPDGYVEDDTDCDDSSDTTNPAADEVCDGTVDDNCNQAVDENCPCTNGETRACGSDVGTCELGTQRCTAGQWTQQCQGQVGPESEVCDGLDNDCDGQVDESFADKGNTCSVGQGECQHTGTNVCTSDGSGTECDATPHTPSAETCDGLDNDCDGRVDEDFTNKGAPCTVGQGECVASGTFVCASDGSGTECDAVAGMPAASETCGDGLDNDCNGQIDDDCQCDYNGESDGVCANGVLNSSGDCQAPATYESREASCDGLDNDCDGDVDEWVRSYMYPDTDADGYGDDSTQSTLMCAGTDGWVEDHSDCDDGDPWTYPGATEICDGKDNNCNGVEADNRGTTSSNWCHTHFNADSSLACDNDGPNNILCCEYDGDPNEAFDCDFETVCTNGVDEDGDGDTDCADPDCDGLSCGSGQTCQSGSCQAI